MNWDDLRYVLAVARERTLTKAAERLGATHTTVGRRLRGIEEALGTRLFDQTPDGFVLTSEGDEVARVASRMEQELLSLESRVIGGDARLCGPLRVATMDLLFKLYRASFRSFVERYPDVELTLASSDAEVSLPHREADVALRMTNTPPEDLVGRKVDRIEFAVFASKTLVDRMGPDAKLADYPWLGWDEHLPNMRWLEDWLAQHAPGAEIVMRLDVGTSMVREAIAAGVGAHFLSCFEAERDPELVRVGPVAPEFSRDVWLVTQRALTTNSRVRAFMDHMDASIRAMRR
ncbi:MAG: LysR family transcriptional regulator [Polyangiaceae bacterium]